MDRWAWDQLQPWLEIRARLPVGALLCVIRGATAGRDWEPSAARKQLRRTAALAGVRRRLASASAAARARGRDGARGRPARRHPEPARTRQPRHHVRLPARHRQRRDHRHSPLKASTGDLSHSRPQGPIDASGICGPSPAARSGAPAQGREVGVTPEMLVPEAEQDRPPRSPPAGTNHGTLLNYVLHLTESREALRPVVLAASGRIVVRRAGQSRFGVQLGTGALRRARLPAEGEWPRAEAGRPRGADDQRSGGERDPCGGGGFVGWGLSGRVWKRQGVPGRRGQLTDRGDGGRSEVRAWHEASDGGG